MKRREFLGLAAAAAVWPLAVRAQSSGKVYRLAQLSGGTKASREPLLAAFMGGLQELGYIEGQNLIIEHRYADGSFDRLPALTQELLAWRPDIFLVSTTPAALAAKAATQAVPIVIVSVANPVEVGLVTSLARPSGNITGITNIGAELAGKRIEILKEMVPAVSKIAVLVNLQDPNAQAQINSAQLAADGLRLQLDPIAHIGSVDDVRKAFEAAAKAGSTAAIRMIDPLTSALRPLVLAHATEFRLPTVYPFREDALEGGLMAYGPSLPGQYRQAAAFVQKILNGAKPAELPVEQPTKFEFVVNLKTARSLGLSVSASLLARADEVIE